LEFFQAKQEISSWFVVQWSLCYSKNYRPKFLTTIKDSDYGLVSNKNSVLVVRAQDLMTSAKNAKTYPTYDVTHKKNKIQNFQFL